jgi:hypothetical protein
VQGLGRSAVTWREGCRTVVKGYSELIRHDRKEETL